MKFSDLKLYAINLTGIGITFTDLDGAYRFIMVVLSLWYAVTKVIEQYKNAKVNEQRRRQIMRKLK